MISWHAEHVGDDISRKCLKPVGIQNYHKKLFYGLNLLDFGALGSSKYLFTFFISFSITITKENIKTSQYIWIIVGNGYAISSYM